MMFKKDYTSVLLFIIRSFRDTADQDYINARFCYFAKLDNLFLWSSLHAIEKYIKSILLFSGVDTKKLNHNILESYKRLLKISDINFDFLNDSRFEEFIEYLNKFGNNRYNDSTHFLRSYSLFELDRTVWKLRRYCQPIRIYCNHKENYSSFPIDNKILDEIEKDFSKCLQKFSISGGYIENVIHSENSIKRKYLILKNPYFGKNKKNIIKNYLNRMGGKTPEYYFNPSIYPILKHIVYFSKVQKKEIEKIEVLNAIS